MAGAGAETQLQLTTDIVAGQRSTIFLLLGMMGWIAIAFVGAVAAAAILGLGTGVLRGLFRSAQISWPGPLAYAMAGAGGFQATLLLGALRQGRRAGNGNWRVGVGFTPVRRKSLIVVLSALMAGWLIVLLLLTTAFPTLRDFLRSITPEILLGEGNAVAIMVPRGFLIAVLAPVSEELFFRGWLWEALRRRGHAPAMTACLTAIPWLLLHGIDSPWRMLVLLPAAITFSLARHLGASVRGSLMVHMTNNTAAVLLQTATLFRYGT